MKWLRRITFALSVTLVLLIVGGIDLVWNIFSEVQGRDHLADQVLIDDLGKNLNKYELLIATFREDSPATVIHPAWMSPDNIISEKRWAEYRKLFEELDLDAGMRSWGGDSIWFISTAQGLVTGGSSKGYMYKPDNPKPLYLDLDQAPKDLESNVKGYRKIDDEWYIVFDWND